MTCKTRMPAVKALAYAIADQAAASTLESNLVRVCHNGEEWYDLNTAEDEARAAILRDARYLRLRRRLIHHDARPQLVRAIVGER